MLLLSLKQKKNFLTQKIFYHYLNMQSARPGKKISEIRNTYEFSLQVNDNENKEKIKKKTKCGISKVPNYDFYKERA